MLARPYRLRQARDIARVYKTGAYASGEGALSVKAARSGRPQSRVVVVVGKKVDKRATVRNRCRRRVIGELERGWETVLPGYDIVVTVHRNLEPVSAGDLGRILEKALRQVKTHV